MLEFCDSDLFMPFAFGVVDTCNHLAFDEASGMRNERQNGDTWKDECNVDIYGWQNGELRGNAQISFSIISTK